MSEYLIKPLRPDTWDAFAQPAEQTLPWCLTVMSRGLVRVRHPSSTTAPDPHHRRPGATLRQG